MGISSRCFCTGGLTASDRLAGAGVQEKLLLFGINLPAVHEDHSLVLQHRHPHGILYSGALRRVHMSSFRLLLLRQNFWFGVLLLVAF